MTASYRYSAYATGGEVVTGIVEARSQAEALRLIHDRGMLAFETRETRACASRSRGFFGERLSRGLALSARVALMRDLATLLKADVALDQALRILAGGAGKQKPGRLLHHCLESVAGGRMLSDALAEGDSGFRADELAMIAAGEQNGSLPQVLDRLAQLLERRLELNQRLVSALIYPALLVVMAAVSILVIVGVLIPNIEPLFEGTEAQIPAVVGGLLLLKIFLETYWPVLVIAGMVVTAAVTVLLRRPGVRAILDRVSLKLPLIGGLARQAIASRICLTLATLLESGVALQQSLGATINVARNAAARAMLETVAERVIGGGRLSQSLAGNPLFDEPSLRLIALGEETNRLHQMLRHVAIVADAQLVRQIERAMTLLTPILTLVLGLIVGGIIMSVMQAILSVNEIAIR